MYILCVDDDNIARKLYEIGLSKRLDNDTILIAASGEEALNILRKTGIDVVITDLIMPEMDGLELLSHVKRDFPATEVILVTGQASVESAVQAMHQGARDYIEKPLDISLLEEKIENIRDYNKRQNETEEYRFAKEQVEQQAAEEILLLEQKLTDRDSLLSTCGEVLSNQDLTETEKLARIHSILKS